MRITKELEALVISTLSRMSDSQFRRTIKASLDGRRASSKKSPTPPKKKLHWKTQQKLKRLTLEKKALKRARKKPGKE